MVEEEGIESGLAAAAATPHVGWAWCCCLADTYKGGSDGGRIRVLEQESAGEEGRGI